MTYYEIIAGSRCYGLNIEGSDIDLCRVADSWNTAGHEGSYHVIQVPREEFADRVMLLRETPLYAQWLFPHEVLVPGDVWGLILDKRERIVLAARKRVWETHFQFAEGMSLYPEHYYPRFPKRLAYSTLFYDMLARYAAGVPFAQAIRPEEETRQTLLAMRRKELPLEDAIAQNQDARRRAEQVSRFYDAEPDMGYLEQVSRDFCSLLGLPPSEYFTGQ